MLELAGRSRTHRLDPHTKFKLFENDNLTQTSGSVPKGTAPSRSRKAPRFNDDGDEHGGNSSTPNTVAQLPPLLANEALALAVSQVEVPMDGWAPLHIFKLFVVLVEPPQDLDFNAIEGLPDYLTQLTVKIGNLIENGARLIASHCWCALLCRYITLDIPRVCFLHFYSALQQERRGAQARRLGCNPQDAQEIQQALDKLVPISKLSYR